MDITRNWRLKTSRSQLLATRCPITGTVTLPQQHGATPQEVKTYTFEFTPHREPETHAPSPANHTADYVRTAR